MRSASSRSEAKRSSAARPAGLLGADAMGEEDPACRRSPRRRTWRGGRRATRGRRGRAGPRGSIRWRSRGRCRAAPACARRDAARGRVPRPRPGSARRCAAPARRASPTTSGRRSASRRADRPRRRGRPRSRSRTRRRRRLGLPRRAGAQPTRTRSSGPSMSTAEPPPPAQVVDLVARRPPRASAAVRCRRAGRGWPASVSIARDRDDVRRVAVVGERPSRHRRRRPRRSAAGRPWSRVGSSPEPRTISPPRSTSAGRAPEAIPERPFVGRTGRRSRRRSAPAATNPRRCRSASLARASADPARRAARQPGPAPGGGFGRRPAASVESSGGRLDRSDARSPILARVRTTVRAYVGLGANVGDPEATLTRGGRRARRAPRHATARRLAPLRHGAGRRHRPARVPQCGRRARRPGRPGPGDRRARPAVRAQGARARVRPPAATSAGARVSSTSTCSSSGARGVDIERPARGAIDRRRDRSGQGRQAPRGPAPAAAERACSCSRRWPTSPPASCRRAGARRSRPRAAGRSGSRAPTRSARSAQWDPSDAAGAPRPPRRTSQPR